MHTYIHIHTHTHTYTKETTTFVNRCYGIYAHTQYNIYVKYVYYAYGGLRNLKRFTNLSLRLNAAILLHITVDDVREFHM